MATLQSGLVVGGLNVHLYTDKPTRTRAQDQPVSCDHQVSSFPGIIFGPCELSGSHLGMVQGIAWARVCVLIGHIALRGVWKRAARR